MAATTKVDDMSNSKRLVAKEKVGRFWNALLPSAEITHDVQFLTISPIHSQMENEEVDRGQNSMSFEEKDLFNKRRREQWALSKDYRNKRRRELRLKKSDNQHTDNYTRYRQQLNSERSEGIICNHNEVAAAVCSSSLFQSTHPSLAPHLALLTTDPRQPNRFLSIMFLFCLMTTRMNSKGKIGVGNSTVLRPSMLLKTSYKHTQPLQPLVQVGTSARKTRERKLKQYYGSESEKPLIMIIKGQV
ncbi:Uncharacterized protein Fot_23760 [Forsythia ovata]|uniref:Uncharacterized protein n=1 Tax=Forsythia ovata TaxID=205694 RepID=A0ABD1U4A0_9LAMI